MVRDFASKLRDSITNSLSSSRPFQAKEEDLPQSPEDWGCMADFKFLHTVVCKIEELIPFDPNIVAVGVDYGSDTERPSVILDLSSGETIFFSLDDLILIFSPRH